MTCKIDLWEKNSFKVFKTNRPNDQELFTVTSERQLSN